ncbi:hypothetical protein NDU88_003628 [Pleurodeles waltl]|uniref:Uncharacterized protein n=1 Tax=Pleurodeles waltl TaxID=8319 RepID=A0AAV7KXY8_PLEWA|nr:hypothetical protein NDU88_003628 [Pleurodeles waltl]
MAYYVDEEEQCQELQEVPVEHQMEERLVEALGHHVHDSMNWALIWALKPFTQPLTNFGRREFLGEVSQQTRLQADYVLRKKKRKSCLVIPDAPGLAGQNLLFSPEDIVHPRSTKCIPNGEVAHYVQDRLRKRFEKEVRNTLRSECLRPLLVGKVADTPELDPSMATFLRKFAEDPKKGLERTWRGCQDKLLEL